MEPKKCRCCLSIMWVMWISPHYALKLFYWVLCTPQEPPKHPPSTPKPPPSTRQEFKIVCLACPNLGNSIKIPNKISFWLENEPKKCKFCRSFSLKFLRLPEVFLGVPKVFPIIPKSSYSVFKISNEFLNVPQVSPIVPKSS